jgi:hypothetical protein
MIHKLIEEVIRMMGLFITETIISRKGGACNLCKHIMNNALILATSQDKTMADRGIE